MSLRKVLTIAVACGLLTLVLAGVATAGKWPSERDGVVLGLNVGGGSAGLNVSGYDSDRESGSAGNLRVGYAFQNQFAVGLEGSAWTKEVSGETWTFSVGAATFTYWPSGQGFYVRGGLGVGSVEYEADLGSVTLSASDNGFGFLGAIGYEWRLTRKFALGPQIDYNYGKIDDDLSIDYFNFTVGANWYF